MIQLQELTDGDEVVVAALVEDPGCVRGVGVQQLHCPQQVVVKAGTRLTVERVCNRGKHKLNVEHNVM